MTSCRHRAGYLGDDEARHATYMARVRPSKKPLSKKMGPAHTAEPTPSPLSTGGPAGSSGHHRPSPRRKGPQPFHHFLDFLVEGQVLDSLQTVVEKAADRMAALKTKAGVPLVDVLDAVEEANGKSRPRARPRKRVAPQHRAQPGLCTGRPNNYPSCSSSASDSRSSCRADLPGLGPLPPIRDRLLLERSLRRMQRLENKGAQLWPTPSGQPDPRPEQFCQSPRPGVIVRPTHKFLKKAPLPSISPAKSSVASGRWNEEVMCFLVKKTLSLLMCKYQYEKDLREQLGFISVPVTGVLMDLFLGFKKLHASSIRLSSKTDWRCVLERLRDTKRPPQPPSPQSSPQPSPQPSLLSTEVEVLSLSLDVGLEQEDTSQPPLLQEQGLPSTPEDTYTEAEEQEEVDLEEFRSLASSNTSATQVPQPEAPKDNQAYNLDEVETYGFMSKGQPQGPSSASSSLDGGEPPGGSPSPHPSH